MILLGFVTFIVCMCLCLYHKNQTFFFFLFLTIPIQTIELGHQGEPVKNVILRIYRQTERDEDQKKKSERDGEEMKMRREGEGGGHYAARLSLGDDCDEVKIFFLHFSFCISKRD